MVTISSSAGKRNRILLLAMLMAAVVLLGVVLVFTSTVSPSPQSRTSTQSLPAGCSKPAGGYLIVASVEGWNDSILHGAPQKSWPVITIQKGSAVNMTVCNTDAQAHGFQITHYFDRSIETVAPGQAIHVSFMADEAGTFTMYCSIFCTIHVTMQASELVVKG